MSNFDNLPPLRDILQQYGLAAKKNLGQNFLLDLNLTAKIARLAGLRPGETALEIGPGPGGLTRALLAQGANVLAIERDERCLPILAEIQRLYPGRLDIVSADALRCDFAKLAAEAKFPAAEGGNPRPDASASSADKIKIIANLPYNIGTELLLRWLQAEPWPPFYQSMTLMFQKEVAERITAQAGDKAYGRLSVLANWRCETAIVLQLPPQAFTPPPKVASAVVHFIPRAQPLPCSAAALAQITQAAFSQRRKMLRQSLKQLNLNGESAADFLERHNIDPTRRAETLSVEEFVRLADGLKNQI